MYARFCHLLSSPKMNLKICSFEPQNLFMYIVDVSFRQLSRKCMRDFAICYHPLWWMSFGWGALEILTSKSWNRFTICDWENLLFKVHSKSKVYFLKFDFLKNAICLTWKNNRKLVTKCLSVFIKNLSFRSRNQKTKVWVKKQARAKIGH